MVECVVGFLQVQENLEEGAALNVAQFLLELGLDDGSAGTSTDGETV